MSVEHVIVPGIAKLPAFCHATIAGDTVYVSGTLGTTDGERTLAPGGTGPETSQTLANIAEVLSACGCGWPDVVRMTVYLTDMADFQVMNDAYLAVLGDDPPARMTLGVTGLALGAAVEIECTAYRPRTA